jgi:hypothetical protein
MIDASKSPLPTWKRYGLLLLIGVLVVVAGAMVWTKELHHSLPLISKSKPAASAPASTAQSTPPSATASKAAKPVATTVPGGIPVSGRNPFGA